MLASRSARIGEVVFFFSSCGCYMFALLGRKGPDTLLWGFILVRLSEVWLSVPYEFKFLSVFI